MLVVIFVLFALAEAKRASGGVYVYTNKKTGAAEYAGKTNNFDRRHREHVRAGHYYADHVYNTIPMPWATTEQMYQMERDLIGILNPRANKVKGGNGPR